MIQQRATLYADKAHIPPEIFAVRNDTGRELVAEIADYTIPSGAAAEIRATLPDGTTATAAGTIDGQTVTAPLDDLLTAEGKAAAQIRITNGGEVTTFGFFVDVTEDLAGDTEEATAGPAEVATFETDAALPLTSLVVEIEPKQDLHGYEKPWPAGGGKNKIPAPSTWTQGVRLNPTNGEEQSNTNAASTDFIPFSLTGTDQITISGFAYQDIDTLYSWYVAGYNAEKIFVGRTGAVNNEQRTYRAANFSAGTPQGTGDIAYIRLTIYAQAGSTAPLTDIIAAIDGTAQLERGATATAWEPYSNICPITGTESVTVTRVGKNLLPRTASGTQTTSGVTFTVNDDGSVTMNGTATANISWDYSADAPVRLDGDYIISGLNGGSASTWRFQYATKNAEGTQSAWAYVNIDEQTRPFTDAVSIFRFRILIASGTTLDNVTVYPMIRRADDPGPTYTPYTGETTTTDLGRTVYGGTVDVVSGELVVDRAMVDLGTLNWTKYSVSQGTLFRSYAISDANIPYDSTEFICSNYETVRLGARLNGTISSSIANRVDIIDNSYSDAAAFKTAMNGVQLVYELSTPETYQLTPAQILALLGGNTIWSDAGQVTVKYRREAAA